MRRRYPPPDALYSAVPIARWLREHDGGAHTARAIECVQRAGDVLYVPRGWGHGVLNLAPSVGVAVEFALHSREFTTPFQVQLV